MVRPIEISDSLTKAETVQREQQNQKVQPEAAQHFQKTFTEKLTEQVSTPNPVQHGDQVVLHVNEQEEEKRKAREEKRSSREQPGEEKNDNEGGDDEGMAPPHDHIDIKV